MYKAVCVPETVAVCAPMTVTVCVKTRRRGSAGGREGVCVCAGWVGYVVRRGRAGGMYASAL